MLLQDRLMYLYDDTSQYLPKTVLPFSKRTVLKVLCYQNIYAEEHGRNVPVHTFIGDSLSEQRSYKCRTLV